VRSPEELVSVEENPPPGLEALGIYSLWLGLGSSFRFYIKKYIYI